jgi:hypothetical protein
MDWECNIVAKYPSSECNNEAIAVQSMSIRSWDTKQWLNHGTRLFSINEPMIIFDHLASVLSIIYSHVSLSKESITSKLE